MAVRKIIIVMSCSVGLTLLTLLFLSLAPPQATAGSNGVGRWQDPVVIQGSALANFDGAPLAELRLYAYGDGGWQPIPFQIDELSATGVFTPFEDGLLDGNDEIVWMSRDVGQHVTTTMWVSDTQAQAYPRYTITVTDPIMTKTIGAVYLYRSTTLLTTTRQYISWDVAAQQLTAVSYTLALDPQNFIGLANFTVNQHPADILDRQKIRVGADLPFPLPDQTFNEEEITTLLGVSATIDLPIVGAIRAVGGNDTSRFAFYGGRVDLDLDIPLSTFEIPFGATIADVRVSLDLNDPTTSGMAPATYYDSNTIAGVPIDGSGDTVPATPIADWYQVSGGVGSFVVAQAITTVDTVSNYYVDNSGGVADDTGDGQSFADTGVFIERTGVSLGDIKLLQSVYVLPPAQTNIGDAVVTQLNNPLTTSAQREFFSSSPPKEPELIYIPLIRKP